MLRQLSPPTVLFLAELQQCGADHRQRLLAAADKLRDTFPATGIRAGLWWRSILMTAFDSGARLVELLPVTADRIIRRSDSYGEILSTPPALVTPATPRFTIRPATLPAIDATLASGRKRELIWPAWIDDDALASNTVPPHVFAALAELMAGAGVDGREIRA